MVSSKKLKKKPSQPGDGLVLPRDAQCRQIYQPLIVWYRAHQRKMPWRSETPNPYHVFVSEAMLQQTQVATVIGYFNRFIDAFPTLVALASASEQEVLTLWQGLGYYRRARALHAAARLIVQEYGGQIPSEPTLLLKLPGIGRYTAGAISSIAYQKPEPLVDGNVARVLARVFAIQQVIDDKAVSRYLWETAGRLVQTLSKNNGATHPPFSHAGELNQALMELGALVCLPKKPECLICPLQSVCQAHQKGLVDQLPMMATRRKPAAVTHYVLALEYEDRWLLCLRPDKGLWSKMWQFPTNEILAVPSPANEGARPSTSFQDDIASGLMDWIASAHHLRVANIAFVGYFQHQTTHRSIRFELWRGVVHEHAFNQTQCVSDSSLWTWRQLDNLADLPLSNPQKRMVRMLKTLER